ncbi:MAG: tetratricopeptide repeat protein [Myxococcota bacterium]
MIEMTVRQLARARMAAAMGDVQGLRDALLELAGEEPMVVLLAQAMILLDQGRSAAALQLLQAMPALEGGAGRQALVAKSEALIAVERPAEAVQLLQAALRDRARATPEFLATLARGLFQSGELSLAERLLESILEVVPHHEESLYGMGVVRLMQGRVEAALTQLQAAQRLNPRRREPYQAMARAWRMLGRPAEGAAQLETLMADNDLVTSPGLARELVELYAAIGAVDGRVRWLRRLEATAQLGPGHRVELGRHWMALSRVGELRRLIIGLGEPPPERAAAYLLAGMAAEVEQEPAQALAYYRAARQTAPELWFADERLAQLMIELGATEAQTRPYVESAEARAPQTSAVQLLRALFDAARGAAGADAALRRIATHPGVRVEERVRARRALER